MLVHASKKEKILSRSNQKASFSDILKVIGPGLLWAGAAIGGSHLIQSTRAGANFGFSLVWLVIICNLLKYPFFEYGHRYTAITGRSLLEGYRELGKPVLYLFFVLNFFLAFINSAGVTMVAAGIAGRVFGTSLSITHWSAIIFTFTALVILIGKYSSIDRFVKIIIVTLAVSTIVAVVMALGKGSAATPSFQAPSPWTMASLPFLVALMGWMPCPIEGSVWSSLWMLEKKKVNGCLPTYSQARIDFHLGYFATLFLALAFISLGALVMFGTGENFSKSGIAFSGQLIDLYVKSLGSWSIPIISIAALTTMLSTTLTVIDAYPRSIASTLKLIVPKLELKEKALYQGLVLFVCLISMVIVMFFVKNMTQMIDFATIISFLAAPIFAFINFRVVTHPHVPEECKPSGLMKVWSWVGIIFLSGVSILFLVKRFVF